MDWSRSISEMVTITMQSQDGWKKNTSSHDVDGVSSCFHHHNNYQTNLIFFQPGCSRSIESESAFFAVSTKSSAS